MWIQCQKILMIVMGLFVDLYCKIIQERIGASINAPIVSEIELVVCYNCCLNLFDSCDLCDFIEI